MYLFLILLLSCAGSAYSMDAQLTSSFGVPADGYNGPRALLPLDRANIPSGQPSAYLRNISLTDAIESGIDIGERASVLLKLISSPDLFCSRTTCPEHIFGPGRLLHSTYAGTTRENSHQEPSRPVYIDHYRARTVESGWFRNRYHEHDHMHVQGSGLSHFDDPPANNQPTQHWHIAQRNIYPNHPRITTRTWTANSRLANTLIAGSVVSAIVYGRNYAAVNRWVAQKSNAVRSALRTLWSKIV